MNRIKLFEEYSEKLWFHIDDDDSTYSEDPCVHFNRDLASKILSSLSNDWTGKLVRHAAKLYGINVVWLWLDLRKGDGIEAIAINQTQDDWFICEWDGLPESMPQLFKCDQKEGLLQFLKDNDIII